MLLHLAGNPPPPPEPARPVDGLRHLFVQAGAEADKAVTLRIVAGKLRKPAAGLSG